MSNLSFINSSLTLVSAGADNVMHVWDAARATLLGTLDLQEPGTHLDGWKYTVMEDEEMQKAAVTQEVSGRSLTGDSASRTVQGTTHSITGVSNVYSGCSPCSGSQAPAEHQGAPPAGQEEEEGPQEEAQG